jgi:hypothetical protein
MGPPAGHTGPAGAAGFSGEGDGEGADGAARSSLVGQVTSAGALS